jgi:hypothetical protein
MTKENNQVKNNNRSKERQAYDNFINMFVELKEQYPNLSVVQFIEQLATALTEANAIILLQEAKKKGIPVDTNFISQKQS